MKGIFINAQRGYYKDKIQRLERYISDFINLGINSCFVGIIESTEEIVKWDIWNKPRDYIYPSLHTPGCNSWEINKNWSVLVTSITMQDANIFSCKEFQYYLDKMHKLGLELSAVGLQTYDFKALEPDTISKWCIKNFSVYIPLFTKFLKKFYACNTHLDTLMTSRGNSPYVEAKFGFSDHALLDITLITLDYTKVYACILKKYFLHNGF